MIDYAALKTAMAAAGHKVSAGDQWTVEDTIQYRQYCYHRHNDMLPNKELMALAYPGIAPEGFPGTENFVYESLLILTNVVLQPDEEAPVIVYKVEGRTRTDVTAECTFESSDLDVLETDGPTIRCIDYGTAKLTATYGELVGTTTIVSTSEPIPEIIEYNTAPDSRSLNSNGTALIGTGIPSYFATSAVDGLLQTFIIPMVAGKRSIGPSVNGAYAETLASDEDASICVGISDLAGVGFDAYDIQIEFKVNGSVCTFYLEEIAGQRVWTTPSDPEYIISDNYDDGTTVQNSMRLRHLKEAGLLPLDTGTLTLTVRASHIDSGSVLTNTITLNTIKA